MVTRKNKMAAKYVEFDRKPNFNPKFPKISLACWSGLSEPTHAQCGPLQRAIVAKWLSKIIYMLQLWLALASLCVLDAEHVDRLSSGQWMTGHADGQANHQRVRTHSWYFCPKHKFKCSL